MRTNLRVDTELAVVVSNVLSLLFVENELRRKDMQF